MLLRAGKWLMPRGHSRACSPSTEHVIHKLLADDVSFVCAYLAPPHTVKQRDTDTAKLHPSFAVAPTAPQSSYVCALCEALCPAKCLATVQPEFALPQFHSNGFWWRAYCSAKYTAIAPCPVRMVCMVLDQALLICKTPTFVLPAPAAAQKYLPGIPASIASPHGNFLFPVS